MLLNGDGPLGSEAAFLQPHDSSHCFVLRGLIGRAEDTQNEETEPHISALQVEKAPEASRCPDRGQCSSTDEPDGRAGKQIPRR